MGGRHQSIINMFPHPILTLDKEGRCLFANDQFMQLVEIQSSDLNDFDWYIELLVKGNHFKSRTDFNSSDWKSCLGNQYCLSFGRKEYLLNVSPAKSNPHFFYSVTLVEKMKDLQDVNSNEIVHFKDLYNNLPVMSVCVDHSTGCIIECNNSACNKLGYSRDEIIGQPVFFVYSEEGQAMARECFEEFYQTGMVVNREVNMICKNGDTFEALLNVNSVRDRNNNIIHSRSTWLDISELRHAERVIKETQEQLIQSSKLASIGELASGIAHEINNPLMYVLAHAQLEIEGGFELFDAHSAFKSFEKIIDGAKRMKNIIDHMREFSRDSKFTYVEHVDVNIPIQASMILLEKKLIECGINVVKNLSPDLPKILGDGNQLEQVMLNLITNSKNALENVLEPTLTISSYCQNDNVIVEVEDNGPGIDNKITDKVFQPFFTTKEVGQGTGLGLSISKSILDRFNGTIEFRSGLEGGVVFVVSIPVLKTLQSKQ